MFFLQSTKQKFKFKSIIEKILCNTCTVIHINYCNAYTAIDPKSKNKKKNWSNTDNETIVKIFFFVIYLSDREDRQGRRILKKKGEIGLMF